MKDENLEFDNDIYNTIRKNIKKYRKEKKITSAKLSELVDLSHDFIRQIESENFCCFRSNLRYVNSEGENR